MRARLLPLLALVAATAAHAQPAPLSVQDVWARPAAQGRVGVLYMRIEDRGAADRLTAVQTDAAKTAELHENVHEGNVMKMRPVAGVPVPAGGAVALAPGGYHVMLMGLTRPLAPGDTFPVTLTFERAGTVQTTATVREGR